MSAVPGIPARELRVTRPVSRRGLLGGAIAAAGAVAVAAPALAARTSGRPFHGEHQPGVTDRPLPFVAVAGFDLLAPDRSGLADLLKSWTTIAAGLDGQPTTVTVGFGPALFERPGLGLADQRPPGLRPLPSFAGDALDPARSDGDLGVVVSADSPSAAVGALRAMINASRGGALLRWRQTGYRDEDGTPDPRGPFGFRDGTGNLDPDDPVQARQLWVADGPSWVRGGTYLVVRRIRLLLDTWDRTPTTVQEQVVGRTMTDGRRLAGLPDSHVGLASPERNTGARLLRRSYTYDADVDVNGLQDSGLIFLAYQRDPATQFVPIQRRLATADVMGSFSQHRASAVFVCPPGCAPGSWLAEKLVA